MAAVSVRCKRFALTIGDPAGIGPEISIKALGKISAEKRRAIVVIGDRVAIKKAMKSARVKLADYDSKKLPPRGSAAFLEMNALPPSGIAIGKISASGGSAATAYIKKAVQLSMAGELSGLITAPIHKKSLELASVPYPGHTEMLSAFAKTGNVAMMLTSKEVRVVLLSTHLSLKKAIRAVTESAIMQKLRMMNRYLPSAKPIAVCGLNPHASDFGLFGDEEEKIIAPAVNRAVGEGINAVGPLPADTLFAPNIRGRYSAILAMYHDQGMVGIKAISFGNCANVTLGLPFVRTSVDHGTAMDIAGKGKADPSSMIYAITVAYFGSKQPLVAARYCRTR